jgi:hypothetical protein
MLLVAIYEMKFYLFLQILKNNGIGFWLVFCFLMVPFLGASHTLMTEKLSGIKNNCHYGRDNEGDCD